MPWHKRPMKDVVGCDKLWVAAKQALIQRFPNGVTRPGLYLVAIQQIHNCICGNAGKWNLSVPARKETNQVISWVVASEKEKA